MLRPERFYGRIGAILALVGVSIGLGDVWRFPYMMGAHGGSAFLLLYLVLIALFAVPMLGAEFALGRSLGGRRAGLVAGGALAGGPAAPVGALAGNGRATGVHRCAGAVTGLR